MVSAIVLLLAVDFYPLPLPPTFTPQTRSGVKAKLCLPCQGMLSMPKWEKLALVNARSNKKTSRAESVSSSSSATPTGGSSEALTTTGDGSGALAHTPGRAHPQHHALPRRIWKRDDDRKTLVPNMDFPSRVRTTSGRPSSSGSDSRAPLTAGNSRTTGEGSIDQEINTRKWR